MNDNLTSNFAIVVNFYSGMNDAVVTNGYIIPDIGIRIYFSIVTQGYVFSDIGKGPNKDIFSVNGSFGNITWFLYTT